MNMAEKCTACPLHQTQGVTSVCIGGKGTLTSEFMILVERPTKSEDDRGVPFVGFSGKLLISILEKAGVKYPDEVYLTYAAKCHLPDTAPKELKRQSITSCFEAWLKKEILTAKPKVIVAAGAEPLLLLTSLTGIMKHRGTFIDAEVEGFKFKVMPTLSPAFLLQEHRELEYLVVQDIKRAYNAVKQGISCWSMEKLAQLDYKRVTTLEQFDELYKELKRKKIIACDIETRGKDVYFCEEYQKDGFHPIVSIQFSTGPRSAWFLPLSHSEFSWNSRELSIIIPLLKEVLESEETFLIGHNFKFDSKWLKKWYNITPRLSFDTMLAHGLFGETSSSLKKLAWEHCVDTETECITKEKGWTRYNELSINDNILAFNVETRQTQWEQVKKVHIVSNYKGKLFYTTGINALTTSEHRWPVEYRGFGKNRNKKQIITKRTKELFNTIEGAILKSAFHNAPVVPKYSDSFVKLAAWYFTEGNLKNNSKNIEISQSCAINPQKVVDINKNLVSCGAYFSKDEKTGKRGSRRNSGLCVRRFSDYKKGIVRFGLSGDFVDKLTSVIKGEDKIPSLEFLTSLTKKQLHQFVMTCIAGDGYINKKTLIFTQKNKKRTDMFCIAAILDGWAPSRTTHKHGGEEVTLGVLNKRGKYRKYIHNMENKEQLYNGDIWCPVTTSGYWVAKRNNSIFITGNTDLGGYEEAQSAYTEDLEGDKTGKWDMYYYPLETLSTYGCCDADVTFRLFEILDMKLSKNPKLMALFKILTKASRAFLDIEHEGIKIDKPYLEQLGIDLDLDMKRLREEFNQVACREIAQIESEMLEAATSKKTGKILKNKPTTFNIESSDHISKLFYDKMKMPINDRHRSKKTNDASVGKKALEELSKRNPIAKILMEYRTLSKQKEGFVSAYPRYIDGFNRIHPDYKLIKFYNEDVDKEQGTTTGRLACSDPNLQQVPSRDEDKKIKKLFIPDHSSHWLMDCLAPGTRILTSDFQWKNIENLIIGDELIGFDEALDKNTKLRKSIVEKTGSRISKRYKVITNKGTVICSDNHTFAAYKTYVTGKCAYGKRKWIKGKDLKEGMKISFLCYPWITGESFEDGWMSGMFEGEGWVNKRGGCGIAQNSGEVLDRIKSKLLGDGFSFVERVQKEHKCVQLTLKGPYVPMRAIGKYRIKRFLSKYNFEGMRGWGKQSEPATVISVEQIEDGQVISVKTSTGTFIAEGLFSHNCDYSGIELRVTAMYAQDPVMKKFFNTGTGDFHRYVASKVYGKPEDQITKLERTYAKSTTFGILYGAGPAKIAEQIGCTNTQAQNFIDEYFKLFPTLKKWIILQKAFAQKHLYVSSLFGRTRLLPDANSPNEYTREHALKRAVNCVDDQTEALTQEGWKDIYSLKETDILLTKNKDSEKLEWQKINKLCVFPDFKGDLISFESRTFSALTTIDHRWLIWDNHKGMKKNRFTTSEKLSKYGHHRIHRTGIYSNIEERYSDDFVKLCGWILTDGSLYIPKKKKSPRAYIYQSLTANKHKCDSIQIILDNLNCQQSFYLYKTTGEKCYCLNINTAKILYNLFPNRILTKEFLLSLSKRQALILMNIMLDGDGSRQFRKGKIAKALFTTKYKLQADMFQFLCTLAGFSSSTTYRDMSKYAPKSSKLINIPKMTGVHTVSIHNRTTVQVTKKQQTKKYSKQLVWCPQIDNQTFVVRRKGFVYITGNTPIQADASDITLYGLTRIAAYLKKFPHSNNEEPSRLRASVHDSILISVHKDDIEQIAYDVKVNILETPDLDFLTKTGIMLKAEVSIGPTWGEQKTLELE